MQVIYVCYDTVADTYKGLIQATADEIQVMDKSSNVISCNLQQITMSSGSVIQCVDDLSKTLILYDNLGWR